MTNTTGVIFKRSRWRPFFIIENQTAILNIGLKGRRPQKLSWRKFPGKRFRSWSDVCKVNRKKKRELNRVNTQLRRGRLVVVHLHQNWLIFTTAWRFAHEFKASAPISMEGEKCGGVFPAHTVVGGFSHSYCEGQVHTAERYGKKVLHCVFVNPKVGVKVSIFLRFP